MRSHKKSPFAPLPGTFPDPRALFVDRWGTLLEVPSSGFARDPGEVRFLQGSLDSLFRANQAGWKIYFLGNEDAVAYGKLETSAWQEIEAEMNHRLTGAGIDVSRNYVCLDRPDGVGEHQGESVYLLPNTGVFYHAAHMDGIDLSRSWVIGDSTLELVAGWRAGLRLASVRTGEALADGVFSVDPELTHDDLAEVIEALLSLEGAALPGR